MHPAPLPEQHPRCSSRRLPARGGRRRAATGGAEMKDRAGQRAGDAGNALHLGDDELAQLVDVARLGTHDDVVRPGHVLGHGPALESGDLGGDRRGLADLGLDEDVGLHRHWPSLPGSCLHAGRYRTSRGGDISVSDAGEFGLIARIVARLSGGRALLGPGDDAAVVAAGDGRVVASTDLLVEGIHFRRDWSSAYDVGRKAAAQNLADIAAMGAWPTAVLVGLAAPPDLPLEWVDGLADGLRDECALVDAHVVGGDVSRSSVLTLAVTALGDLRGRQPVTRAGASPGDVVVVAGRLGYAAAGLALLGAGHGEGPVADAHRRPDVAYAAALRLPPEGAPAMMDVSDGLVADVGHIAAASQVRIELASDDLPLPPELVEAGLAVGVDPMSWVAGGGEAHVFVATMSDASVLRAMTRLADLPEPVPFAQIGRVVDGAGVTFVDRPPSGIAGHDHFAP